MGQFGWSLIFLKTTPCIWRKVGKLFSVPEIFEREEPSFFPMMGMRPFGPSSLMVVVIELTDASRVPAAVTKISSKKLKKPPSRLNLKMMIEASVV